MKKLIHCGASCKVVYEKPLKSSIPAWSTQVFLIYKCPSCKNELFRWHGVNPDGAESPLTRITAHQFQTEWSKRLTNDALKKLIKDTRSKVHAGEFTVKASRDPAQIADYMAAMEYA